jgi:nucleotide-binding universal stress UspA family protein
MNSFQNILVIQQTREEGGVALKHAVSFARGLDTQITLVAIIKNLPAKLPDLPDIARDELRQIVLNRRHAKLEELVRGYRREGIRITTDVLAGEPVSESLGRIVHHRHDLVVLHGHEDNSLHERLFGNFQVQMLRNCPIPVLLVQQPPRRGRHHSVIAAVGPDLAEDADRVAAERVLQTAHRCAELLRADVHVVHAWEFIGEGILRGPFVHMRRDEVDRQIYEFRDIRQIQLDRLVRKSSLDKSKSHVHLIRGNAAEVISGLARRKRADLIVLGLKKRTAIADMLIGHTAEAILRQVDCPVFVVKPKDFALPADVVNRLKEGSRQPTPPRSRTERKRDKAA